MSIKRTSGESVFNIFNIGFLILLSLVCLFPYVHVAAMSLSSKLAATSGEVLFWPVDFTLKSFEFLTRKGQFVTAFFISIQRVLLGTSLNIILITLCAYPLSKSNKQFRLRSVYVWYFVITMLVSGGLIPTYLVVRQAHLIDSIWALILPGAVSAYSLTIMLNFFRGLPKEMEEAAFIDGAGHFTYLIKVVIPLSIPCIMTLMLFSIVSHWNAWFDGFIYNNKPQHFPLQTLLMNSIVQDPNQFAKSVDPSMLKAVSQRTIRSAQILISSLPVLAIYPFMQKYFVKGMVLGSVKG